MTRAMGEDIKQMQSRVHTTTTTPYNGSMSSSSNKTPNINIRKKKNEKQNLKNDTEKNDMPSLHNHIHAMLIFLYEMTFDELTVMAG